MKKILLSLVMGLVILTSCSIFQSREHRAQNHLSKAISLDPKIVQSTTDTNTIVKDSIRLKDSIRIKDSVDIRIKDSTIIRPESNLGGNVGNPCDSITGQLGIFDYNLGTGYHRVRIWSDGKKLRFNSQVDELISTIQSKDTYILHLQDSISQKDSFYSKELTTAKNSVVTVIKYEPRWYNYIIPGIIFLVIGFIVGYLVRVFTKFRLPFLGKLLP